jgi:chromosome segregation ATPase
VAFRPVDAGETNEVRVDGGESEPTEAHFFVAVCAHRPQTGNPTFVYLPSAGNVLRERETHIALLEGELRRKDEWLEKSQRELVDLDRAHRQLTVELEESNRWAESLNEELASSGARVEELQQELAAEQDNARSVVAAYEQKISALERENLAKSEWAESLNAELAAKMQELSQCVDYLHEAEKTVEERTQWAQSLDAGVQQLRRRLAMLEASRWVRLGRRMGMGPDADPQ